MSTETSSSPVVEPVESMKPAATEPETKDVVAEAPTEAPKEDSNDATESSKLTPISHLWIAAKTSSHPEIWGVTLADPDTHVPTRIILQKYLNANDGDVTAAKDQLAKTLEWRSKMKPLDLLKKAFNKTKFGDLGYVTTYASAEDGAGPQSKEVFNWNIYGATKSIDETFGNLEQ